MTEKPNNKLYNAIEMLTKADQYIMIIKEVLNGSDVNKLNEITDCSVFNWFAIEVNGEEVNIGLYLTGKNLVELYYKDQKFFKTIVSLQPAIDKLRISLKVKYYTSMIDTDLTYFS